MHSSAELTSTASQSPSSVGGFRFFRIWNLKLHVWIGLFTLLFVWLFAWTGLLLNHQWKFAEFWENRRQTTFEREFAAPPPGGDLVQARDILRQLGLAGEIEWTATRGDGGRFDFRVSRPGQIIEIKADLDRHRATVQRIDLNKWGTMRLLHTFTGVRMDDARNQRDWYLTTIWAISMDGVAIGLILMALTGIWLWWERAQSRLGGGLALGAGVVCCGLFWVGLRWIY